MIRVIALALGAALCALALLPNAPRPMRTCDTCGIQTEGDRNVCHSCLYPADPRPTGSEGMGR